MKIKKLEHKIMEIVSSDHYSGNGWFGPTAGAAYRYQPTSLLTAFGFFCASLAPLSLAECVKKNYGFLEMLMPTGSRRFLAPNNSFGALKSHFSQRSGERKKEARYATPSTCRSVPLGFSSTALVVSSTWCPVPLQPTVLRSTPPSPSSKMKCPFAHYVK